MALFPGWPTAEGWHPHAASAHSALARSRAALHRR